MSNLVSVVRVHEDVNEAVRRAIDLVGGFNVNKRANVVIKPNLCSSTRSAESGVTTDVRIVEALIRYLQKTEENVEITIVEANSEGTAIQAFRRHGYNDLREKYGVELCSLSRDNIVKMSLPNGKKLHTLEVPETLLFMDYFVSIAKLKTQVLEGYSGIWKNQFGCIPKRTVRPRLHPFLPEVLFDLNNVFKADLCLIDGITGLEGPGPLEGTPKRMDAIICGKNGLSVDVVGTRIMGFGPRQIAHLKYAIKHFSDAENVSVVGDGADLIDTKDKFKFISKKQHLLYRIGLKWGRFSSYLKNLGLLTQDGAYALRAVGFSQIAEGEILSFGSLFSEIKKLLFKFETSYDRA